MRPKKSSSPWPKDAIPAAAQTCWMRRMPRKAQLSKAPESRAETGEEASLWASGSQLCRGASPILVP